MARSVLPLIWPVLGVLSAGCFAFGEPLGQRLSERESDAGPPTILFEDDLPDLEPGTLDDGDPHAVRSADPSHGPFTGNTTVLVRGAGFASDARVWFDSEEVDASAVIALDPRRIQVVVPPGEPGPVEIAVQNGSDESTRRTLPRGYTYDPFYLEPASSPISGGLVTTLHGSGTNWDDSTEVLIDLEPCEVLAVRNLAPNRQELDCRVPAGTVGSKPVRVTTAEVPYDLLDGFLYADSVDGFRGGLGGAALDGTIRVIVLDDVTGSPVAGARVVLGDSGSSTMLVTNEDGVASADAEGPKMTVTAAANCYHPITFVDVPVETVTVYLDPIISPACQPEGDPPSVGGSVGSVSTLSGEIVFPGAVEFKRSRWVGVPEPTQGERAAYVFTLSRPATSTFRLPPASAAITPDSGGTVGYEFELSNVIGNLTLYAVAGIENRDTDPPLFTAYAMGLLSSVRADAGTSDKVYIPIDNTLDRSLDLVIDGPEPTGRGPDRVRASVAVRVGRLGYVILPNASATSLLPTASPLSVVGLPPLGGSLSDASYVISATADTGLSGSVPRSVVGLLSPAHGATSVTVDGFVEVPRLETPAPGAVWDGTEIAVSAAPGGAATDLLVLEVFGPAHMFHWVIVAPAGTDRLSLPDPTAIDEIALPSGTITIEVNRAKIDAFSYGSLGYRHLGSSGWDAFATDTVTAVVP